MIVVQARFIQVNAQYARAFDGKSCAGLRHARRRAGHYRHFVFGDAWMPPLLDPLSEFVRVNSRKAASISASKSSGAS